jgi:hypothetical protein
MPSTKKTMTLQEEVISPLPPNSDQALQYPVPGLQRPSLFMFFPILPQDSAFRKFKISIHLFKKLIFTHILQGEK